MGTEMLNELKGLISIKKQNGGGGSGVLNTVHNTLGSIVPVNQ